MSVLLVGVLLSGDILRFLRNKSKAKRMHKIKTKAPRIPPTMAAMVLEEFLGEFEEFEMEGRDEELRTADAPAVVLEEGFVSEAVGFDSDGLEVDAAKTG